MPRLVLITIAHVEDIGRARHVISPLLEGGAIDGPNTGTRGESARALTGALTGLRSRRGGEPCGPPLEDQPVEEPAPGAVPEHVHLVWHARRDEARPPQDASGARHTINRYLRRRVTY